MFKPYINSLFLADVPFLEFVFQFYDRISSLQRYFEYTEHYIAEYLNDSQIHLKEIEQTAEDAVEYDCWSDIVFSDKNYFQEQHYMAILANLFCRLENLLADEAKHVATLSNKTLDLKSNQKSPYIDKYLIFLVEVCRCPIVIPQATKKKLNVIRRIRNQYMHQLGRDISFSLKKELNRIVDTSETKDFKMNYQFIDTAFQVVADIATEVINGISEYSENFSSREPN